MPHHSSSSSADWRETHVCQLTRRGGRVQLLHLRVILDIVNVGYSRNSFMQKLETVFDAVCV